MIICTNCGREVSKNSKYCGKCGQKIINTKKSNKATLRSETSLLYPINLTKFILLSLLTFSIYDFYWMYKNWAYIKGKESSSISPFWRSFFGVLYSYELFKKINEYAVDSGVKNSFSSGWRAFMYFVTTAMGRASGVAWLFSFLSVLVFITPIRTINFLNDETKSDSVNFSAWESIFLILGGIFWVLIIFGGLLGE